ncbi:MAG: hypothetical protein COA90_11200 [Gammaproteobacteria bacterium]|nr:MAG: hypothetical protein COA90_11200 [Gammaproteobacteria bacterium]
MGLSKKLGEWQDAKLIDSTTAEKISDFEKQKAKPIALWAFGGLGAFAIILGLISVVASNWMHTPDWLKLTVDLVLCLIIALTLFRVISQNSTSSRSQWLREILVIFYYGFTLASMALIGQTYQLGGSIAKLLLVWTLVTIPIVLLGRGKFLTVLWIVGTSVSYALNLDVFNDFIRQFIYQNYIAEALLASLYILSPFLFIILSRIPWLVSNRPIMAGELSRYSWLAIIIGGWLCQFLWYDAINTSDNEIILLQIFLSICLFATAAMVTFIPKMYASRTKDTHLAMRVVLISTFIMGATALWHEDSYPLIGAIASITYMFILAWAALKIHSIRMFNVMTAFICIRLLFIYFEVFGSMLETGLGLVVGGVITLFVVWGWFKKSASVAHYFGLSQTSKRESDTQ